MRGAFSFLPIASVPPLIRNRFYSPDLGRFISSDPLGMVDGPNTYGFCGGDPVNRVDPMGTDWEWNEAKKDWEWIWKDAAGKIIDQEIPRSLKPAPLVRRPQSGYGHHYVPEAQVNKLVAEGLVTPEAKRYLYESEGSFQGWVEGAGELDPQLHPDRIHNRRAPAGTAITHEQYEKAVLQEAREFIGASMPAGKPMGVSEAQDFLRHIKRYHGERSLIREFNKAVVAEIGDLTERVARARSARRTGGSSSWTGTAGNLLAVATVGMIIHKQVKAGESLPGAVYNTGRAILTELPKQPIRDVENTAVTILNTKATVETVTRVIQQTSNARERERYATSVDQAHSISDATLWLPRGGETVRAVDNQARALVEGAGEGVKGLWDSVSEPVSYWGLYLLSIGAGDK